MVVSNQFLSFWVVNRSAMTRQHSCFHRDISTPVSFITSLVHTNIPWKSQVESIAFTAICFVRSEGYVRQKECVRKTIHSARCAHLPNATEIPQVEDVVELGRSRQHLHFGLLPQFASRGNQTVDRLHHTFGELSLLKRISRVLICVYRLQRSFVLGTMQVLTAQK